MRSHEFYMRRCFDLARLGAGQVAPNPMVGAVLVHNERIIGEGYHRKYGMAHAEVNAVASVAAADRHFLSQSTLYVSLEPCCIFGNTPPCTNLIIEHKIPKVVISCIDKTAGVNGHGLQLLRAAGVELITGILESEGQALCKVRNTYADKNRPFVRLKFAQSRDGFMGRADEQVWLSNAFSKRLVHKWRSETAAIIVGTNTAITDNPRLTNRLYHGDSPLRIVLDRAGRLSPTLHLFDGEIRTWILRNKNSKEIITEGNEFTPVDFNRLIPELLDQLVAAKKSSLLVEGGRKLLQSFIDEHLWDEAYVFITAKELKKGISAPILPYTPSESLSLDGDQLLIYRNNQ